MLDSMCYSRAPRASRISKNLSGWKLAVVVLSAQELEYYQGLFA
jgi:hypothetical protein